MIANSIKVLSAVIFLLAQSSLSFAQDAKQEPERTQIYRFNTMLTEYLELIKQGNIESAKQYWLPASRERAERLGIVYQGVPFKTDLNSPVLKSAKLNPTIKQLGGYTVDSVYAVMEISATVGNQPLCYSYYAVESGGYAWLVFSQDVHCRAWDTVRTKYFNIHFNPKRARDINSIALNSLDKFVDSIGVALGITPDRLAHLAESGMEYFLCVDEAEVGKVSGAEARGRLDQASDAVFSSAMPHYHEVAHLLINYRFGELPLTTLPFLKEGFATYLGGRSGRAPAGMLDMASYLFNLEIVAVDSLLELMSFHINNDASIAYSSAALFIKFLVETYGMDVLLAMYLDLSGEFAYTASLTADQVRSSLESNSGATWSELSLKFEREYISGRFRLSPKYPRLRPGLALGMSADSGERVGSIRFVTDKDRLYIIADVSKKSSGTLLFNITDEPKYHSQLFEEHFGAEKQFEGHRYAIRFDINEAGLYDYATSTLLAKHIESFALAVDPSVMSEYLLKDGATVVFSLPLALTGGVIPGADAVYWAE
ncbi:hypothetical protein JYT16_01115 [Gemmatimonas aurantiaca]|nr:hypothetical protein [Gemmatimonas aurantiaca]